MNVKIPNLCLENVEVLPGSFRNFAGAKGRYNKEGNRNFNVVLTDETKMEYAVFIPAVSRYRYDKVSVEDLIRDGWNVREMKPRDGDEPDAPKRYKLNIAVSYPRPEFPRIKPPVIHLYSRGRETLLDEETVGTLDWANYQTADLTIRPRPWEDDDGTRKIKAYLQEMRVTVEPDRWDEKYASYGKNEDGTPFREGL